MCSIFLDARGVISVAQRAEYIARIRDLTKRNWKNLGRNTKLKCLNFSLELFSEEIPSRSANRCLRDELLTQIY